MTKKRSRYYYGIIFLFLLTIMSLCKGYYTKYTNNKKEKIEAVYKEENRFQN